MRIIARSNDAYYIEGYEIDLTGLSDGDALSYEAASSSWVTGAGAGHSGHALLDGSHLTDTTASTVTRGDIITGQGATPKWKDLALGASGKFLKSDGTDVAWGDDSGNTHLHTLAATMRPLQINFNVTTYYSFNASGQVTTTETDIAVYLPFAATLKNLYAKPRTNTLDNNCVVTVRKNSAATSLTVTISAGSTTVATDTANTASFSAGDYYTVQFVTTASTSGSIYFASVSCECDPT